MFQPISRIMASLLMAFTAPLLAAVDTSSAPSPQPADQPPQPQVEMQQPQPQQPQVAPIDQQPSQNPPIQQTPPPPNASGQQNPPPNTGEPNPVAPQNFNNQPNSQSGNQNFQNGDFQGPPPQPNWNQNQNNGWQNFQQPQMMPPPQMSGDGGQMMQQGGRFMFGQPPQGPQGNFQNNGMMEENNQQNQDQQDQQKQMEEQQKRMEEQQQKMEQRQQQMAISRAKATARMLDRQSRILKNKVASLAKRGLHLSVECQQGISAIDDLSSKLKSATNSDDIDSLMQDMQDTGDTLGSCMMQSQQVIMIPSITKMVANAFARLKKNKVDIADLQDEYNSDIVPLINNVKSGTATDDDIDNLFSSLDDFRANVEAAFSDNDIPLPNLNLGQPPQQPGGPGQDRGPQGGGPQGQ